jgi:integrase
MDSNTKFLAFDVIKAARDLSKIAPTSTALPATLESYEREIGRLIKKNQARFAAELWAAICNTQSKRTYYRRIAAARNFIQSNLELALRQQDKLQRNKDDEGWLRKVRAIEYLLDLHRILERNKGNCPITDPVKRHSKRQDIRGLPDDWREQMLDAMEMSKYKIDYLVAAVTGCRPHELQTGIEVHLNSDFISFTIKGAKVKTHQGQPERTIQYSVGCSSPLVKSIIDEMRLQQAEYAVVKVEKKENFTSALRRFGKKLWPRRHAEITPYCLRHAAASDFKRYLPPEDVSRALGHAVDATASIYGQRQMSTTRSGLQPTDVRADRLIKITSSLSISPKQKRSM